MPSIVTPLLNGPRPAASHTAGVIVPVRRSPLRIRLQYASYGAGVDRELACREKLRCRHGLPSEMTKVYSVKTNGQSPSLS